MKNLRFCLEVQGLAVGENNERAPAGLQLTLGEYEDSVADKLYAKMAEEAGIAGILKLAMLDRHVRPEDCRIISPEEYDKLYGDDAKEEK